MMELLSLNPKWTDEEFWNLLEDWEIFEPDDDWAEEALYSFDDWYNEDI